MHRKISTVCLENLEKRGKELGAQGWECTRGKEEKH